MNLNTPYCGDIEVIVHVTSPSLFGREHDPNAPRNRLGPSPAEACGLVSAVDGLTVSNATWSWSMTEGARNEKSERNSAVNMSSGAR